MFCVSDPNWVVGMHRWTRLLGSGITLLKNQRLPEQKDRSRRINSNTQDIVYFYRHHPPINPWSYLLCPTGNSGVGPMCEQRR